MFEWIDAMMSPVLNLPPVVGIGVISFAISLLIILIYKWTTDQVLMKQLKEEIKQHQKDMKASREDPKKAIELQKKAMEVNMKYMMQSFKPMIFTLIPVFLIFGWLSSAYAADPIMPGQEFQVSVQFLDDAEHAAALSLPQGFAFGTQETQERTGTKQIAWNVIAPQKLQNPKGDEFIIEFTVDGKEFQAEILITNERRVKTPIITEKEYQGTPSLKDAGIQSLSIGNKKAVVMNLFGWKLGWLGTYIIFSLVFSLVLRKLMKVY